jgi:hypothetical protein
LREEEELRRRRRRRRDITKGRFASTPARYPCEEDIPPPIRAKEEGDKGERLSDGDKMLLAQNIFIEPPPIDRSGRNRVGIGIVIDPRSVDPIEAEHVILL